MPQRYVAYRMMITVLLRLLAEVWCVNVFEVRLIMRTHDGDQPVYISAAPTVKVFLHGLVRNDTPSLL